MKVFLVLSASLCLVTVSAEPPRFRNSRFRPKFQRQELAPPPDTNNIEPTTASPDQGPYPYPPSGYQPAGPAFTLPSKQELPSDSYGAPLNTYGPPDSEYGAPVAAEPAPVKSQAENLEILDVQKESRFVLCASANGKLEKIELLEEDDKRNTAHSNKIQVRDEDNTPIFAIPRFIRL